MAKKMRGFMCHAQVSSAVMCVRSSSVTIPRVRTKCIRLGEQRRHAIYPSMLIKGSSFRVSSKENQATAGGGTSQVTSDQVFQVVVMRVSLHCQGCASKLKKHLSKMEGVKSFSIELESKRVTVEGHISPSSVLESVSKVKKAEFWAS